MGETLPSTSPQLSSSISVIISNIVYGSLKLDCEFKSWTYVTSAITLALEHLLQSSDPDSITCLDIGCKVILVYRDWLLKRLPTHKINTISTSLNVRSIGASKHKFSEFVALFLYFSSKNIVGNLVYVLLQYEIHFVEGL